MSSLYDVPGYTKDTLYNVYYEYQLHLTENINNMIICDDIKQTLVEDIPLNVDIKKCEFNIAILDVGGSFFKIAVINIKVVDGKLKTETTSVKNFEYPIESKNEQIFWYDWVSDKFVEYMLNNDIKTDLSSLIFSYPIKYKGGKSMPMALAKHWCFEFEETLKSDLKETLNHAIKNKLFDNLTSLDSTVDSTGLLVNCVLNDSVATFLSSKVILDDIAIGIILGTGTNGSFIIKCEDKEYVYNAEWGSFVPKSLALTDEETDFINSLQKKYNLMDILIGNGYKCGLINQIIKTRSLNLIEIEGDCVKHILQKDDDDEHKIILQKLIYRSRQLMSMLVCGSINVIKANKICILLNGSGYSDDCERQALLKMIQNYAKEICGLDVEIKIHYEEGLTFIGAAYYSLVKFLNENVKPKKTMN